MNLVGSEHRLAGEYEYARDISDAQHWVTVYADLLAFKRDLLTQTQRSVVAMGPAARAGVVETDLRGYQAEVRRIEQRLAFWQRQSAVLLRNEAPADP